MTGISAPEAFRALYIRGKTTRKLRASLVHRGRSNSIANANANSDASRENSLANVCQQISSKKPRTKRCEGIRERMRVVLRMRLQTFCRRC